MTETTTPTLRTATVFTDPPSAKPPLWVTPIQAVWPLVLSLVLAILIFHFVVPRINDYQQVRISDCGIYIILAVSLTVVNGFTGQFSIGHSGFMAVGGYAAASLMYYGTYHCYGNTDFHGGFLSFSGLHTQGPGSFITGGDWLFLGSLLFGAVISAAIGWVVGLPSLRLRGDYLAIVTLGFCEIVRVIIQSSPDQLTPKPTDPDDVDPGQMYLGGQSIFKELHHVGGALGMSGTPTYATVFWITLAALVTLALTIRLKYSGYGRAMLSIREDDIAAQAVGVNITRIKVRAFVFSAFFAGLAGGLSAMKPPAGTISAGDLGFQKSFEIVIMVVIGGLGSISGAAIAAVLITLLPEWLRNPADLTPWHWCHTYWQIALLVAVVAIAWNSPRYGRKPIIACATVCAVWEVVRREAEYYQVDLSLYRTVIFALLLIVTMILRPQGLFGVHEIWDYLPVKWHWWNRPSRSVEAA